MELIIVIAGSAVFALAGKGVVARRRRAQTQNLLKGSLRRDIALRQASLASALPPPGAKNLRPLPVGGGAAGHATALALLEERKAA